MICQSTIRCPTSIDYSNRSTHSVSLKGLIQRHQIIRAVPVSLGSSTSCSSSCLGSSSNSSSSNSRLSVVSCCDLADTRAPVATICDGNSYLSSTEMEQQHAGLQHQQPLQQQVEPPSTVASAAAVSRRSLASVTAATLLWGGHGLPAWALRTVSLEQIQLFELCSCTTMHRRQCGASVRQHTCQQQAQALLKQLPDVPVLLSSSRE